MQFHPFADRDALMRAAADQIENALQAGIESHGAACAALSGGSTPEPAYALLAARDLDWPRVTFALVDERCVPPDHPASNEAMLRRALSRALDKGARLTPMWSDAATPADAAALADAAYAPLRFDIAAMGMGGDGHTASWFPGSDGLPEALTSPQTVIALRAPQAAGSADRLTLTRTAIMRASSVLLLITGEDKRARLIAAENEPPLIAPVAALLTAALDVFWAA